MKKDWKNPALYKTRLCDNWALEKPCRFSTNCWYAHGPRELREVPHLEDNPSAKSQALAEVMEILPQSHVYTNTMNHVSNEKNNADLDVFRTVTVPVLNAMVAKMSVQQKQERSSVPDLLSHENLPIAQVMALLMKLNEQKSQVQSNQNFNVRQNSEAQSNSLELISKSPASYLESVLRRSSTSYKPEKRQSIYSESVSRRFPSYPQSIPHRSFSNYKSEERQSTYLKPVSHRLPSYLESDPHHLSSSATRFSFQNVHSYPRSYHTPNNGVQFDPYSSNDRISVSSLSGSLSPTQSPSIAQDNSLDEDDRSFELIRQRFEGDCDTFFN